jgi:ribosomal-protein-alanine N-acetyltransferase
VTLVQGSLEDGWSRAGIRSALEGTAPRSVVAVARSDSEQACERWVGIVLARRVADLLEIDQVGVLPGERRRGAAQAMLRAVLERARAEGLREARLELAADNVAARGLYTGLGFVVVGRRSRYYPGGEDALLLSLELEPTQAG